jgi:NADH-quinone oxidoreductase subunit J
MTATFLLLSLVILASAISAMTLRNLVHCALALTLTFAGLAGIYLELNAQFIGFAQILIYIGAVAILVVFAILLTRGSEPPNQRLFSASWPWGIAIGFVVFGVIAKAILSSSVTSSRDIPMSQTSVRQLGDALMTRFVLPLEVVGLLLTVALLGGVIIALRENLPMETGNTPETSATSATLESTSPHSNPLQP